MIYSFNQIIKISDFPQLPNEIWCRIITLLRRNELGRVSCCSKHWQNFAMKALIFRDFQAPNPLNYILQYPSYFIDSLLNVIKVEKDLWEPVNDTLAEVSLKKDLTQSQQEMVMALMEMMAKTTLGVLESSFFLKFCMCDYWDPSLKNRLLQLANIYFSQEKEMGVGLIAKLKLESWTTEEMTDYLSSNFKNWELSAQKSFLSKLLDVGDFLDSNAQEIIVQMANKFLTDNRESDNQNKDLRSPLEQRKIRLEKLRIEKKFIDDTILLLAKEQITVGLGPWKNVDALLTEAVKQKNLNQSQQELLIELIEEEQKKQKLDYSSAFLNFCMNKDLHSSLKEHLLDLANTWLKNGRWALVHDAILAKLQLGSWTGEDMGRFRKFLRQAWPWLPEVLDRLLSVDYPNYTGQRIIVHLATQFLEHDYPDFENGWSNEKKEIKLALEKFKIRHQENGLLSLFSHYNHKNRS